MIVNSGLILLEEQQLSYMASLQCGLFTANVAVAPTTTLATLTASEAAWTGYTRQALSGWPTPTIVGGQASSSPPGLYTFTNATGAAVTFFGWFLVDPTAVQLVAGLNIGTTVIAPGSTYSFSPTLTDANTGP